MNTHFAKQGIESNTAKGKRFEAIVKDVLIEIYGDEIAILEEQFYLKEIKQKIDFHLVLKSGEHIFAEAKYGNGSYTKGLKRIESTKTATNLSTMTKLYCQLNSIDNYSFQIYTNATPNPNSTSWMLLRAHMDIFETIDDIYVIPGIEDEVDCGSTDGNNKNLEEILFD